MTNSVFPWGKVIANFVWILGLAGILADLSCHNFLVIKKNLKWEDIVKRDPFLKPAHLSCILIAFGLGGAVSSPMLGGVFGAGGFLLSLLFVREKRFVMFIKRRLKKR